ncbi:hypothetical protein D3C87_1413360 [compost metagenome]
MKGILDGIADARRQVFGAVAVHQEPDRSPVHAIDELARVHRLVQRLQHEAIAAERDDDVGLVGVMIAVDRLQIGRRFLRLFSRRCQERE